MAQAEEGIAALGTEVDSLIVVPNEKLLKILERRTSIKDAFKVADDVLRQAVQGISDLVTLPGLINLDFADVRTTMLEAGDAILGIGMGAGEHRAILAAEKAVSSPLLDNSVEGAHSLLLSITGGPDLSLIEASEAAEIVREAAHPDANIIFGANVDEGLSEQVWVTVIATRFDNDYARRRRERRERREPHGDGRRDGDPTIRTVDRRADWERRWASEQHYAAEDREKEPIGRDIALQESDRRRRERRDQRPGTRPGGGYVLDVPEFIPRP
jgi:cell division protein FtsZ